MYIFVGTFGDVAPGAWSGSREARSDDGTPHLAWYAARSATQGGRGVRPYTSSGDNYRGTIDGVVLYCH
jgi:hypothetical protein